ncbi:hypothetical protein [Streptomyces sp. NRRL S-15]|uniref:hypothetical protein n=1 Tax=Streptomyces sp. NRRL S-15 TaxID=1463886 RepID=UPI0004C8CCC7|nr:hypothetical protein [Streptomyces sp. NRRL S-15]
MTEQDRLNHLLDRLRRGVLLPAEGEQLAGLVAELEAENARLRDGLAHCRHKPRITELEQQLDDATGELAEAREHNDRTCEAVTGRDVAEARIDRIRDAARRHRQQLIRTSELYAVIEALDHPSPPATT